jgi:hypothetical protein
VGLSLATLEKATTKDGAIEQDNFDSYTPARMADMPEIDIAVIANGEPARARAAHRDGGCSSNRKRNLQCGRRARSRFADNGGERQSGHDEDDLTMSEANAFFLIDSIG